MQSALVPAFLVALFAIPLNAQVARSAGLSPSPVLPPSGQPSLEGQFVYLGPTVHELTVFYPLRAPDGKLAGYGKVIRIRLGNGVSPQVSVRLRRNPDETFLYTYAVANLSGARQALAQWSLPVPAGVGAVGAPGGWQVTADGPIDSDYRAQGPEQMSGLRRTVTVTWSTERGVYGAKRASRMASASSFSLEVAASERDFGSPEASARKHGTARGEVGVRVYSARNGRRPCILRRAAL